MPGCECNFCLWKENKYLQSMEKDMDARMTAELLKNGSVHVKDLYSRKKDLYFEADLHMETDENGRVTFSLSFPKRKTMKKNFEADLHMETDENGRVTFSLSFPKRKTMKKNKRK